MTVSSQKLRSAPLNQSCSMFVLSAGIPPVRCWLSPIKFKHTFTFFSIFCLLTSHIDRFLAQNVFFLCLLCPQVNPPFIYTPPHTLLPSFSVPTYFTLICTSFRGANRFWQHFWETSPLSWPRPSCLKVLLNGTVVSFENACWIQLI